MIRFRQKEYSENTITLYHATRKDLLPKILKEGLKVSTKDWGKERESRDGLPPGSATGILYLSRDLKDLVIDPRLPRFQDKYVLLEIKVPRKVYNSWDKDIDPIYKHYRTKKDWILGEMRARYFRKPDEFPDFEKEIREETGDWGNDFWKIVYPKSHEYKMIDKEISIWDKNKSLVIKNNIPPEYIGIKKI